MKLLLSQGQIRNQCYMTALLVLFLSGFNSSCNKHDKPVAVATVAPFNHETYAKKMCGVRICNHGGYDVCDLCIPPYNISHYSLDTIYISWVEDSIIMRNESNTFFISLPYFGSDTSSSRKTITYATSEYSVFLYLGIKYYYLEDKISFEKYTTSTGESYYDHIYSL